jgi:hypothetical protein
MVGELLQAYKQIRDIRRKERAFAKLKASALTMPIIKDLVNSAQHGIVIHVTLADNTQLDIRREDAFDKMQDDRNRVVALPDGTKVRIGDLW